MAVPGFHFVLRPSAMNDRCVFCVEPTMSWSIRAEVQDHHLAIPIETVCADCAMKIVDMAIGASAGLDLTAEQRLAIAKRIKLSATQDLAKRGSAAAS